MNWMWIVLIMHLLGFVYKLALHIVSFRSAGNPTPANVADIYDAEEYKRWLAYDKECNKLSLWRHLVSYAVVFLLIGLDGYAAMVNLVGANSLYSAAIVIMIGDTVVSTLWSTPFSYIRNMGIEQKYGFNKMTKKTFFVDLIKETIISFGLMCGLICIVVAVHQALGNWLLIILTAVIMAFLVIMVFLQPVFPLSIYPIFTTTTSHTIP